MSVRQRARCQEWCVFRCQQLFQPGLSRWLCAERVEKLEHLWALLRWSSEKNSRRRGSSYLILKSKPCSILFQLISKTQKGPLGFKNTGSQNCVTIRKSRHFHGSFFVWIEEVEEEAVVKMSRKPAEVEHHFNIAFCGCSWRDHAPDAEWRTCQIKIYPII